MKNIRNFYKILYILMISSFLNLILLSEFSFAYDLKNITAQVKNLDISKKTKFPNVNIELSIKDDLGRTIPNILKDNISIKENNNSVTNLKVEKISAQNRNLNLGIIIDVSKTSEKYLNNVKEISKDIINKLYPNDKVLLYKLDNDYTLVQKLTDNKDKIKEEISYLSSNKNINKEKKFYDVLLNTINVLSSSNTSNRNILVFSDGKDRGSSINVNDIISKALGYGIKINTINYEDISELKRISIATNSVYLARTFSKDDKSLNYDSIINEIVSKMIDKSQENYYLSYKSNIKEKKDVIVSILVNYKGLKSDSNTKYIPDINNTFEINLFNIFVSLSVLSLLIGLFLWFYFKNKPKTEFDDSIKKPMKLITEKENKIVIEKPSRPEENNDIPKPIRPSNISNSELESDTKTLVIEKIRNNLAHLIIYSEENRGKIYTIIEKSKSIGSSSECDIVIQNGKNLGVSKKHAQIRFQHGNYVIVDIGSTNGVYINQSKIDSNDNTVILNDKDSIELGNLSFIFKQTKVTGNNNEK